ncbi:MAG: hypothetical protein WA108_08160, partial [Thiobacillus sp.]
AIQKCLLNQYAGLLHCARNDGHIEFFSVGAALAAMRRKAQRANARQGLAVPPLWAGARIAAKAAPTVSPVGC